MKTNTIQVIASVTVLAFAIGLAGTKVTGDYVTGVAAGVAYLAVAALVAMTASDYSSQRGYSA